MKFRAHAGVDHRRVRVLAHVLNSGWAISPRITGAIVKHVLFHPQAYPLSSKEEELLRTARDFRFSVHDKRIRTYVWGEGPGVLFVHGWNGRGIQFHRFIAPLLAKGYSAVAIDGPAHGESEGRHTNYFEFSDTVRAFMKLERRPQIKGIIAHSLGASAAVNCQSKDKHPVKMVLLAPAVRMREMLQQNLERYGVSLRIFEAMIEDYERQYGYSLIEDDPIRLLRDIQSDILIVHDRKDQATPFVDVQETSAANPRIQFFPTEGLGHFRLLATERIIDKAIDFLT